MFYAIYIIYMPMYIKTTDIYCLLHPYTYFIGQYDRSDDFNVNFTIIFSVKGILQSKWL